MYTTSLQGPVRDVRVTPRRGGSFTHGNRNVVSTAPELTSGLLAPPSKRVRLCNQPPPRKPCRPRPQLVICGRCANGFRAPLTTCPVCLGE